jgi:sensor histidine kinase YesM
VTAQDFIFSNQPKYRITRHSLFWISWFLFMLLAIHIPANRFANWQIEIDKSFVAKKGGMASMLLTMTWRQSWVLLSHIAFTYVLLYFILPLYFIDRKKWLRTTVLFILLFLVFLTVQYYIQQLIRIHNARQNIRAGLPLVNINNATRVKVVLFQVSFSFTTVAGIAVSIKLLKRWWLNLKETEEFAREKARMELQLLRAQIHPHFLFNTLNNIYFFTLNASPQAPDMIKKLSGLLHYIMNECNQVLVPLEKELQMIQDYIALEKIRYGEQMNMKINIRGDYKNKLITPLLLIPFVENCFKHGASKMITPPEINLEITMEGQQLQFLLTNSKPQPSEPLVRQTGLGLKNVKKRLQLLYPGAHELTILSEPASFIVLLKISLSDMSRIPARSTEPENKPAYVMA